jgi:hypothetical protein
MQAFLNDEARLQAESLPFLLPHAKKIDDLTNNSIAHRSSASGFCMAILLMRKVGRQQDRARGPSASRREHPDAAGVLSGFVRSRLYCTNVEMMLQKPYSTRFLRRFQCMLMSFIHASFDAFHEF